ncbi:MAG: hypothetical protein IPO15_15250 [Anaerolineae bacterium]|uniref:hypothetical protein n=1 Tax=Candidatus Amarolinea dominans TaxID=3140696 RepID=UPI0031355F72|nr:hypothetical protein [Anaerolineae bacterium]
MNLDQLLDLLDHTPVIADIHPVSLCYLPNDVMVSNSLAEVVLTFDELQPILMAKLIITSSDPMYTDRFPHVRCEHEPFTSALNSIIFNRFDDIASCTLLQSELAGCIVNDAKESGIVVVLLVDGLSYQDVRDWNSSVAEMLVTPCLVDVPSL